MSAEAEKRSSRIIKNLHNLCSKSSSPVVVITCLVADGVLTTQQGDEIKLLGTDYKQFERIYTLVKTKLSLPNTYSSLMNALKNAGQHHIVQILADDDSIDKEILHKPDVEQMKTTLAVPLQIKISDYAILADLKNNYTEWMKSVLIIFSSVDSFTRAHNQAHENCFKKLKIIPADNKNKLRDDLTTFLKAECTTQAQTFIHKKQQQLLKDYQKKMNTFVAGNKSRFEVTRIDDTHNTEIKLMKKEYENFLKALPSCIENKPVNFTTATKGHITFIKDQNNLKSQGAV